MTRKVVFVMSVFVLVVGGLWAQSESSPAAKNPVLPVILNVVPGLGLGSFVEGDPLGGVVCLGGELLAVGLFGYGLAQVFGQIGAAVLTDVIAVIITGEHAEPTIESTRASAFMTAGVVVGAGTAVFAIVRPITFASSWNARHASGISASFAPTLSPVAAPIGTGGHISVYPGFTLTLRY